MTNRRVRQQLTGWKPAPLLDANGRRLVSERYDFDQYIRDLETMFQRVIAESPR